MAKRVATSRSWARAAATVAIAVSLVGCTPTEGDGAGGGAPPSTTIADDASATRSEPSTGLANGGDGNGDATTPDQISANDVTAGIGRSWLLGSEPRPAAIPSDFDGIEVLIPPRGPDARPTIAGFQQEWVGTKPQFAVFMSIADSGSTPENVGSLTAAPNSGRNPCTHSQRTEWEPIMIRGHDGCRTAFRSGTRALWVERDTTYTFVSELLTPTETASYLADWS